MTENFAELFEQSLANKRIKPGTILMGLVIEADARATEKIMQRALVFPGQHQHEHGPGCNHGHDHAHEG